MQFRWWNSFNLLAVILLAIGIMGLVTGGRMVYDPGRPSSGYEWLVYLVAGGLMLVNGFLPPSNPVTGQDEEKEPRGGGGSTADSPRPPASEG